jgi:hypothetical protein
VKCKVKRERVHQNGRTTKNVLHSNDALVEKQLVGSQGEI